MAPKLSSKDKEEVIHTIQAQLTIIQNQLEDTSSKQSTLEAKNDNLHSHVTSLLDQVTLLTHPENPNLPHHHQTSPLSSHSHSHQQQPHSLRSPALTLPFLKVPILWAGSFRHINIFHFIKFP